MRIKLIKKYNEYEADKEYDIDNNEDAQRLIKEGFAEEVKTVPPPEFDADKIADKVFAKIKAELKPEMKKIEFPNKDTKKFNFEGKGFFHSVMTKDMDVIGKYLNFVKATGQSEGIDSEGGYEPNAHFKSCYMLEIPKANTTYAIAA